MVRNAIRNHKGLTVVAALTLGLYLLLGVQYFYYGSDSSDFVQEKLKSMELGKLWYAMLYVHIAGAMTALCLGWLQFAERFRRGSAIVHRFIGGVYAAQLIVQRAAKRRRSGSSSIHLS